MSLVHINHPVMACIYFYFFQSSGHRN